MPEYTKDEALAFVEATRLTLVGKVGFAWLVEKLSDLAAYIESVATENERLNAFIDESGVRSGYEEYRASHPAAPDAGDATGPGVGNAAAPGGSGT